LIHQMHEIYMKDSRKRKIILSINPFVPKPHTPFQWAAMNREKELKSKMKRIESKVKNLKGMHLEKKSIRQAILQGILSLGNRRVGEGLFYHIHENLNFSQAWRKAGVDVDSIIFKEKDFDSSLPWDIIDSGINRKFLKKEFAEAKRIAIAYMKKSRNGFQALKR
jgi:radical SAM superfamily enzyme YgiQ (UPF0313 family)